MSFHNFVRAVFSRPQIAFLGGIAAVLLPALTAVAQSAFDITLPNRADIVFDPPRNRVYVTTSRFSSARTGSGFVRAYDLSTGVLAASHDLGGSLIGADLTPDGASLLAAQNSNGIREAVIRRLNFSDGTQDRFGYFVPTGETPGPWQVLCAADNIAFVTSRSDGTGEGTTAVRRLNLNTGAFVFQPLPDSGGSSIVPGTIMRRSADRTRIVFCGAGRSDQALYSYSTRTGSFGPVVPYVGALSAVSRDGALATVQTYTGSTRIVRADDFVAVRTLDDLVGGTGRIAGTAFDPTRDVIYLLDYVRDVVIAVNLATYEKINELPVGLDVSFAASLSAISPDGRWLAVMTSTGYRVLPLSDVPPSRLVNVSTRLRVGTGNDVPIGGFAVRGGEKRVLVRVLGPSLSAAGIADTLADPSVRLVNAQGSTLLTNENWRSDQASAIQAAGLAPPNDRESALIARLAEGNYTAIAQPSNGGQGVCLIEVYDLDAGAGASLVNLSTRGRVSTGDNVMIGGFVVQGGQPKRVLIRALGPSLATAGVTDVLSNPSLEVYAGSTLLRQNNDWRSDQAAEIIPTGLAPTNDLESAALLTLPAGAYTAIVRGVGGTTGNALIEIYELP